MQQLGTALASLSDTQVSQSAHAERLGCVDQLLPQLRREKGVGQRVGWCGSCTGRVAEKLIEGMKSTLQALKRKRFSTT